MKNAAKGMMAAVMVLLLFYAEGTAAPLAPIPETTYAAQFMELCDGQQWFADEVERLLNAEQKTLAIIENPSDLDSIKSLGLQKRGIVGRIPRAVGELHELRYLFLSENRLSGEIPQVLYTLPKLQNVDLSSNEYAMPIPPSFGNMAALTHLNLRGNAFSGNIPEPLLQNTKIVYLDVSQNKLTGALPAGLGDMTALTYLAVSDNAWGGALPDLSGLTKLKTLSAWNCKLTGTIPDSLYTLTDLQVLDLAGNALTGALAPALGKLTALQLLSVGTNELHGAVPSELGQLTSLITLDLSDNGFSGVLPDAFAGMNALQTVHIENNRLRGLIPSSLKAKSDGGAVVYAQNNYLTGAALKEMAHNEENFTDGAASEQYQLTAPEYVQISKERSTDLYALLRNRSLRDGNTSRKLRLPQAAYTAAIVSGASLVALDRTDDAILVSANAEIPKASAVAVEIAIRDNIGSDYSKVTIRLTTDTLGGGGGGGGDGGGTPPASTAETHRSYVAGYPDGTFRPEADISREEIAKMLISVLEEQTPSAPAYSFFTDVEKGRWSAPYVERARRLQYLLGDTGGAFRPEAPMTRAELAACLSRAADSLGKQQGETKRFADVSAEKWYASDVDKAASLGLISGYADDTFRPENKVTRAEAVTMMNRLVGRDPKTASTLQTLDCPFRDVELGNWAYGEIMEAAVQHVHQ